MDLQQISNDGLDDVANVYLYSGNVFPARRTTTASRIRVSGGYTCNLLVASLQGNFWVKLSKTHPCDSQGVNYSWAFGFSESRPDFDSGSLTSDSCRLTLGYQWFISANPARSSGQQTKNAGPRIRLRFTAPK